MYLAPISVEDIYYIDDEQHAPIVVSNAHAHLLHPVCARGQINQLAKKLVSLLAVSLERFVKARNKTQNPLPT